MGRRCGSTFFCQNADRDPNHSRECGGTPWRFASGGGDSPGLGWQRRFCFRWPRAARLPSSRARPRTAQEAVARAHRPTALAGALGVSRHRVPRTHRPVVAAPRLRKRAPTARQAPARWPVRTAPQERPTAPGGRPVPGVAGMARVARGPNNQAARRALALRVEQPEDRRTPEARPGPPVGRRPPSTRAAPRRLRLAARRRRPMGSERWRTTPSM